MGSLADYGENKVLDSIFGAQAFNPATLYFGLSTSTITDAGGNITEPSGGSYARVTVTNSLTNFPAASGGSKSNGTKITFPTATASWGVVTDFFIADAVTAGNIIAYGTLTTSKTITTDDTVEFGIGYLTVTLN